MSGRGGDRGGMSAIGGLRGALVVVVIAVALGVIGGRTALKRPDLSAVNLIGIVLMVIGAALTVAIRFLAEKQNRSVPALAWLSGVLVCGIGAAMVFM